MAAGLAIALANGVIGKLGEIAAQAALNEASLLLNFKTEFKWLEKKLRQISASLQAADEQSGHDKDVKEWLAEVRNIAFDAEDIIDECAVKHLYANTNQFLHNCSELVFRYKMGKRIKELKDRIRSTIQEAQELKLFHDVPRISQPSISTSESERGEELRRWTIFEKDSPAVAVDHKVDEILTLLENPAVGVVAVVAMGGLGKTFLLQHVFNRTKHRYECSAWISVSQTYSLRKLQCDLASHIDLEIASQISGLGITDGRAAELIHNGLENKKCLIVLDDVWRSSVEDNLILRLGPPTERNNQCKIVVTTRSRDVGENMNAHFYEMQHLSDVESWDLFCLFAFPDREANRPPELERLAHQIVEECGRLPLAIKTVAASMAKSSLISDWESKLGQLKKIREVPDCVRRLKSLQFLDISYCTRLQRLPQWIGELKCLSYLNVVFSSDEDTHIGMPNGMSQILSLRILKSHCFPLSMEENEFLSVKDVGNLLNLQEIRFSLKDVRSLRSVEDGILDHLVKMRILGVWNDIPAIEGDREESSLPAFSEKMNAMKGLQQLQLTRFSVPSWICGMENVTQLGLEKCSDYPSLQKMPNLQLLMLRGDSKCRELPKEFGESGGFPKLVDLQIHGFPLLEELPALEEEAMQRLELLYIKNCPRVKRVPEGLERLRRLKMIDVEGEASGELEERLKEGGEDWNKIKANNPRIEIVV